jgi:hypothetical protein
VGSAKARLAGHVALCGVLAALGCDRAGDPHPLGRVASQIQPWPQESGRARGRLVRESCVHVAAGTGALREIAAVAPEEHPRIGFPQDVGWTPGQVAEVVAIGDTVYVLDGLNGRITRFTDAFQTRFSWGRQGQGPGEFVRPVSLTLRPAGGIAVLDAGADFVSLFTSEGQFETRFLVERNGESLAVGADGRFYIGHSPFPAARRLRETVVTVYSAAGEPLPALVELHDTESEDRRLVLGGPNPVTVRTAGDTVIVLYPVAGVADIYVGSVLLHTLVACMPQAVAEHYKQERGLVLRGQSTQEYFPLVTDILLWLGVAYAASPVKEQHGLFHIGRFDHDGRDLGSLTAAGHGRSLLAAVKFAGRPDLLVSYSSDGIVALLQFEHD